MVVIDARRWMWAGTGVIDGTHLAGMAREGYDRMAVMSGGPVNSANFAVRRMISNVVKVFAKVPAGKVHPATPNGVMFGAPRTSPVIGGD